MKSQHGKSIITKETDSLDVILVFWVYFVNVIGKREEKGKPHKDYNFLWQINGVEGKNDKKKKAVELNYGFNGIPSISKNDTRHKRFIEWDPFIRYPKVHST